MICDIESIEEIQGYTKNHDHMGMILTVKEKDKDDPFKIMIDVKAGEPCIDQVYDSVYGTGRECSKRIIIFTGGRNPEDRGNPAAYDAVVGHLAEYMNQYPLDFHLFKIDNYSLETDLCDFFGYRVPTADQNFSISDIPTELSFRNSEFWLVYFDSLNEAYYRAWKAFEFGFKEISEYGYWTEIDKGIEGTIWWNDSGIDFIIEETSDSNGFLNKIWSIKQNEFQNRYGADRMGFEYLTGRSSRLKIRYLDRPLEWLLLASSNEKAEFANALHEEFSGLYHFFTDLYLECKETVL